MRSLILLFLLYLTTGNLILAQDDLLLLLEEEEEETIDYTYGTFKGTKIIHSSSVDIQAKGELQFLINHRFGTFNSGADRLWGLDDAEIRLGFEYGLSDSWSLGLGRSSQLATYDFFSKLKLLRQSTGLKNIPLSVVLNVNMAINSRSLANPELNDEFTNRLFYTYQLLIARKFNSRLSIQISPTVTHNNVRETISESNDTYYLGLAARYRFTKRMAVVADYYYIMNEELKNIYDEPLGFGLEIETGGHVFQITVSNSSGMTEKLYLARTVGDWKEQEIRLGFNISRTFPIKVKK